MPDTSSRVPWLAAALSFLAPGLGQLYNRETGKGIATLCIAVGTWIILFVSLAPPVRPGAWLSAAMLVVVYFFLWIPAVVDAYQEAAGRPNPWLSGRSGWYVILMLLVVGPMALPMLWQSPAFSRAAKGIWTAAVVLIAVLVLVMLAVIGPILEGIFRQPPVAP
jgi:hypothetical protein